MQKRGSHVGMIASFSIFILFLVGMYLVLQPVLKTQKDKDNIINYLENALIKEFSGDLITITVSPGGSCTEIDNSAQGLLNLDAVARDKNGVIGSIFQGNFLNVETSSENLIWIYYANVSFEDDLTAASGCVPALIKSFQTTQEIFEEKIIAGIEDFENFKTTLNVPQGNNFGFSFIMNNGTEISANSAPEYGEVYSKKISLQYINSKAERLSGEVIIRAW